MIHWAWVIPAILLGLGVGKLTQPITINNVAVSESTSISSSTSMSGSILINNDRRVDTIIIDYDGVTNVKRMYVTNGVTNY
jgi:hypothetical protein